jgi:hypothetical protein
MLKRRQKVMFYQDKHVPEMVGNLKTDSRGINLWKHP